MMLAAGWATENEGLVHVFSRKVETPSRLGRVAMKNAVEKVRPPSQSRLGMAELAFNWDASGRLGQLDTPRDPKSGANGERSVQFGYAASQPSGGALGAALY